MSRETVRFPAVDGVKLCGWLYPAATRAPAVILTPGFACVKEMLGTPEVAEAFQQAGFTALLFDPRCTGESEGEPRQQCDPHLQISDYSDALTFLSRQPSVDSSNIYFWGYSFSGTVALCAAALDKRARSVIAICPLTDFSYHGNKTKMLAKAVKDRVSQVHGNEPFYLPILTEAGESLSGFGGATNPENYKVIQSAMKTAPLYENRATIQTYYRIAMWQPLALIPMVGPVPTLVVTPGDDQISKPTDQTKLVQSIVGSGKKQQHVQPGKGHMDILFGESFAEVMDVQIKFLHGQE